MERKKVCASNALMAEAKAVLQGCLSAKQRNYPCIIVESLQGCLSAKQRNYPCLIVESDSKQFLPPSPPRLNLSLYIQQPNNNNNIAGSNNAVAQPQPDGGGGAFIFHRMLTEGPENASRVLGKAQGFIIPAEHFTKSGFNVIYLTFYTPQYSGSLSVEAKHVSRQDTEELTVMGGTGSFAFARGVAVFAKTTDEDGHVDQQSSSGNVVDYATYHVNLQLRFPNQSETVLG